MQWLQMHRNGESDNEIREKYPEVIKKIVSEFKERGPQKSLPLSLSRKIKDLERFK